MNPFHNRVAFFSKTLIAVGLILFFVGNINGQTDTSKKKSIKIKLTGSLSLGYWLNVSKSTDNSGKNISNNQPNWFIMGQPTLSINDYQFPFSANYANNQFTHTQPFNQLGVSPTIKWATFHAGYRNLKFSKYTLSGVTFLGGGIELNPGKFRFGAFYGRFAKGVTEDSSTLGSQGMPIIPTYERWGYGLKLGLGSKTNYLDFLITKIIDDSSSINRPENSMIKPGDNLNLGLASKQKIGKKLSAEFDAALSVLTNDVQAFGNFEGVDIVKPLIILNASSTINPAANAALNYQSKYLGLGLSSEFIGPTYRSFGIYYIQNDLWRNTIRPSIRLFKRKLNLSGNIGYQTNNVANQKSTTTIRMVSSANIQLKASKSLMTQLMYSNFGTDQNSGRIQLNDSIRVSQINQSYGGNIMYTKQMGNVMSNIILSYMQQSLDDLNVVTEKFSESQVQSASATLNLSHNPSKLSLGLGVTYNQVENASGSSEGVGPSARLNANLFKGKIQLSLGANQQFRTLNDVKDGTVLSLNNTLNLVGSKHHRIGIIHQFTKNNSSKQSMYLQQINRLGFTYGYTF